MRLLWDLGPSVLVGVCLYGRWPIVVCRSLRRKSSEERLDVADVPWLVLTARLTELSIERKQGSL